MMEPMLSMEHISKEFQLGKARKLLALNDVSLQVYRHETLGIVGESGCGKTTLAKLIMGALEPTSGEILFEGKRVDFSRRRGRLEFARKAQMIFQDSATSLDGRMTVETAIAENLRIQGWKNKDEIHHRVLEVLEQVGLSAAYGGRFPHELSGGQRQRVGIARALVVEPKFVVCDEPIAALDLSIQSQIVNLLKNLGREMGLTYIFIAHDLNMVRYVSDRIVVMYRGGIMEMAASEQLFEHPMHPYTRMLQKAMLSIHSQNQELALKIQDEPAISLEYTGCPFAPRCPMAKAECSSRRPFLREYKDGHWIACHLVNG